MSHPLINVYRTKSSSIHPEGARDIWKKREEEKKWMERGVT